MYLENEKPALFGFFKMLTSLISVVMGHASVVTLISVKPAQTLLLTVSFILGIDQHRSDTSYHQLI